MKQCLECNKEFEPKREHGKFCSDRCRISYNRKHPKGSVTQIQVQVLYNAFMDAISKIQYSAPKESYDSPKKPYMQDEPDNYTEIPKFLPKVAVEAIKRKYVEDKRDCTCDEEYLSWLQRLEADNRLTTKDKELIKTTP